MSEVIEKKKEESEYKDCHVCGDNVHKLNTFGGDWAGDEIVFCSKECARAALLDSSITQLIEVIEGVIGGQE